MRPRTQKQPQVKKELCRVLDYVNVNCDWFIVLFAPAVIGLSNFFAFGFLKVI